MITAKNIFGLILVLLVAAYMIFADVDSDIWGSFYFCVWNLICLWFGHLLLKSYRDKILSIVIKIIMGVSILKLFLNVYSFFDIDIFNKINRSHEAGGVVVGCILIFLIYSNGRLVKR